MFIKMALKNYEMIDWVELWVLSRDVVDIRATSSWPTPELLCTLKCVLILTHTAVDINVGRRRVAFDQEFVGKKLWDDRLSRALSSVETCRAMYVVWRRVVFDQDLALWACLSSGLIEAFWLQNKCTCRTFVWCVNIGFLKFMSLRRRFPFTPLAHNVHYSKLRNNVNYSNLNNVHYLCESHVVVMETCFNPAPKK